MQGQDEVLEIQHEKAPSARRSGRWQPEYEAARKTQAVLLRLTPEDALALRVSARANARTISAHVARLVAVSGDPIQAKRDPDPLADASSLNAALVRIPNELRRLRSDIASKGGLVKSLFIRPESMASARSHSLECSTALHALHGAADAAAEVICRVEEELATVRVQLEQLVIQMTDR